MGLVMRYKIFQFPEIKGKEIRRGMEMTPLQPCSHRQVFKNSLTIMEMGNFSNGRSDPEEETLLHTTLSYLDMCSKFCPFCSSLPTEV